MASAPLRSARRLWLGNVVPADAALLAVERVEIDKRDGEPT
jgi:hypothetical protein